MRRKAAAEAARLLRGEPLREPVVAPEVAARMIHDLATMTSPEAAEAVARSRHRGPPDRQHRAARAAPAQRHRHDGRRAGRARGRRPAGRRLRALRAVRRHAHPRRPPRHGDAAPRDLRGAAHRHLHRAASAWACDTFVLVNWHEGNIASMNAVATDLQDRLDVHLRGRAGLLRRAAALPRRGRRAHPRRRHRDARDAGARPGAGEGRAGGGADPAARRRARWTDAPVARGLRLHHRRLRAGAGRLVRQPDVGDRRTAPRGSRTRSPTACSSWSTASSGPATSATAAAATAPLTSKDELHDGQGASRFGRPGPVGARPGARRPARRRGRALQLLQPGRGQADGLPGGVRHRAVGLVVRGAARRRRGRGRHRHDAERHAQGRHHPGAARPARRSTPTSRSPTRSRTPTAIAAAVADTGRRLRGRPQRPAGCRATGR